MEQVLDGGNLGELEIKKLTCCMYHIAQCAKRRVAARAKAAGANPRGEELISGPNCLLPRMTRLTLC